MGIYNPRFGNVPVFMKIFRPSVLVAKVYWEGFYRRKDHSKATPSVLVERITTCNFRAWLNRNGKETMKGDRGREGGRD